MPTLQKNSYTLAEVDMQLDFLSKILKYSQNGDREKCMSEVDRWLDKRIRLMDKHAS